MFEVERETSRHGRFGKGDAAVVMADGNSIVSRPLERERNGDLDIDLGYNLLRTSGPNQLPIEIGPDPQISLKIGTVTPPPCSF
jgi:hypothetical protein